MPGFFPCTAKASWLPPLPPHGPGQVAKNWRDPPPLGHRLSLSRFPPLPRVRHRAKLLRISQLIIATSGLLAWQKGTVSHRKGRKLGSRRGAGESEKIQPWAGRASPECPPASEPWFTPARGKRAPVLGIKGKDAGPPPIPSIQPKLWDFLLASHPNTNQGWSCLAEGCTSCAAFKKSFLARRYAKPVNPDLDAFSTLHRQKISWFSCLFYSV